MLPPVNPIHCSGQGKAKEKTKEKEKAKQKEKAKGKIKKNQKEKEKSKKQKEKEREARGGPEEGKRGKGVPAPETGPFPKKGLPWRPKSSAGFEYIWNVNVHGLGFRVWGLGFRVLGFRSSGFQGQSGAPKSRTLL